MALKAVRPPIYKREFLSPGVPTVTGNFNRTGQLRPYRAHKDTESEVPSAGQKLRPQIKVPKPRPPSEPPAPVPIVHSSTYTISEDLGSSSDDFSIALPEKPANTERSSKDYDSPIEYVLQRADESLAQAEKNPPKAAKVFWEVAQGPVGGAVSKGLRGVLTATVSVGKEAARAGAPAAKWAAKQGGKLVFSAIARGIRGGPKQSLKKELPDPDRRK